MAALIWRCRRCGWTSPEEGTCDRCLRPFVLDPQSVPPAEDQAGAATPTGAQDVPATAEQGAPSNPAAGRAIERLALRMPWRQQINLPEHGEFVLGRSSDAFRTNGEARSKDQVSRQHARFYREPTGDLYVQDLQSANGTYLDGVPVGGSGSRIRAGQVLRLAQDVDCRVIRLNEHGEPELDGEGGA